MAEVCCNPAKAALSLPGLRPGMVPLPNRMPPPVADAPTAKRRKIWALNGTLHCSIIGTCLSAAELRGLLGKVKLAPPDASDHDLHGIGVSVAGRHDLPAKLLNKALDERYRVTINQFAKARTEAELRGLWRQYLLRGDIPGAYWATLTHPAASHELTKTVFGEVHMLSHLAGSANRADIRRLADLEAREAELRAKLDRQQRAFHEAVTARDAKLGALQQALAEQVTKQTAAGGPDDAAAALEHVIADLGKRLAREARAREAAELRAAQAEAGLQRNLALERENGLLRAELQALEQTLENAGESLASRLDGLTLLYVGARPHQVPHLRALAERFGCGFLHHDGGREQQTDILPGLISRADMAVFPVDCISHEAALAVKRLCRQGRKRYVPLRSAGAASLAAMLSACDPRYEAPRQARADSLVMV